MGMILRCWTVFVSVVTWLLQDGPNGRIVGAVAALLFAVLVAGRRVRRSYGVVKKWITATECSSCWLEYTNRVIVLPINRAWDILRFRFSLMCFSSLTVKSIGLEIPISKCECVRIFC